MPDFPKAGILFYDITTLLQDRDGFRLAIDSLALPFKDQGIDVVVGIESRGFIFGAAVADRIGAGFTPVRKPGKLPSTTVRATYDLEYGTDTLEIHHDGVGKGQRVLIVDDLLATGGTAKATTDLVQEARWGRARARVPDRAGRAERPRQAGRRADSQRSAVLSLVIAALIVAAAIGGAAFVIATSCARRAPRRRAPGR